MWHIKHTKDDDTKSAWIYIYQPDEKRKKTDVSQNSIEMYKYTVYSYRIKTWYGIILFWKWWQVNKVFTLFRSNKLENN